MPRKRGNTNRGKKSGRGSGTAEASGAGSHVQNVRGSVHQHSRGENLEKDKESAFQSLEEMFRETLDADVIHMVLAECDWKVDDALESLITLSGAGSDSSRSVHLEDERSTLSGIASSLFTYPSRLDDMQNDLSGPSTRFRVGPRDEDFDVTDEEDHYDDFDLGTRDEMMLDQISDSIGISDDQRVVPPIKDFENSLEQIDDTPLLHSSVPARTRSEHQVPPNLPWNSKANPPDLTCLYPSSKDNTEARATSVPDSSKNKSNESPKGFAKSIQLAETYEKLAQSSNYYLYDFEEISSASSFLNETESNPVDFELRSGGSPDLELYESGPFRDSHGPHLADLEKRLGNTIPKPLELFVASDGANSDGCVDSQLTGDDFIVSSINVISSEKHDSMSSPHAVKSDSPLINEPLLPSVGEGEDSRDKSFNLISSKNANPPISVETIGSTQETDLYSNNHDSPLSVVEPALDAESVNNPTDNALRGIYGSLEGPDVVAGIIQDKEARLGDRQKLTKNSESDAVDIGDDFEDILAAAAAAAEAADGDDKHGDPSDDSETGKKFVHVYTYSSTSSSKEDSPEPLGAATGKKVCRKKKKRSGGAIQAVYSGSEDNFRRDADGLVKRMVGARDFLENMNSEQSAGTVEAHSEINFETNPERSVEVETLCQRMFGFRNVLKTQGAEKSDSDVVETFDIDEMSDIKTLSHSDSESSDSSHRKTWPDILDLPNSSSKPIATISADIADRIPELEVMEYNLETIQESAEFSDGADDFSHEKGSIRRFITLDKIELPPKVQRQADLVATKDDIRVNVKEAPGSEHGTSCDENSGTYCEDVIMAHDVCIAQDAVNLEENDDVQESAKNGDDIESQTSPCFSGNTFTSQEIMKEISGTDAPQPVKQPVLSDPDPEAMIKMMLGMEAASRTQSLSYMHDQGGNKKSGIISATGDIGADSAIKKLLGIGASDDENRTSIIGSSVEQSEGKLSPHESAADETVALMKKGEVVESQSKLSVNAEEFVPTGPLEHLPGVSAPGIFLPPNVNSPISRDLPQSVLAYVTPKMNAGTTGVPMGLPPVSYQFNPVAAMMGFQQPFVPQPAFQSGVFYHSGENVVAQPNNGQGRGRSKEKRGGRKSPFSKLAANFNQFSQTELPAFMSVPPGLNHGARIPTTRPDLRCSKQQLEKSGKENAWISHIEETGNDSEQPKSHSKDESAKNTVNSCLGKTSITEDLVLPEKCSGSEQGKTPSFAAMAAKSSQGISNHQPQGKNTRSTRSQELSANEDQVQTVRRHLDNGDKVLIMMRGCPGSGKSTLARQLLFNGVILSTDDFFVSDDGHYLYEQEKIGDAHEWNQERALRKMKNGVSPIIIDNTNIQIWEMKPYVIKGIEHGYKVEIVEPNTPWQFKPGELARRNSHNVSKERITRMIDRYNRNVTVEQIVGSSDKLRSRAVQKQQANMPRTKDTKPKRTRSEKKTPTIKSQPKVMNRFAILGDENETLTAPEDDVIVERQALPIETEGISADVKVDVRADDIEAESSGSQSGEITPDVVVESDGANSADGEEVAATLNDAVMKHKELLQDHSCVAVDKVVVHDGTSGREVPNDSSESGIEVDSVRVRDDNQSSKADVKKLKEADVVLSSAETVFTEKETIVDSCVPAAGTLLGAEQTNLRRNVEVKTENIQVGSEPLPSGKRSPRTGWAGWGSSTNKGSGPTVSKNQKLSSGGNEWASTGENQSYFWSEAQGLVKDNKHVDVLNPKSESIVDLPHAQKSGVEVVSSAGDNVWEEPKTRRERRQRNRDHNSPSKVINTQPNVTDSHVGDNLSETLAPCPIREEKHSDSDTANLLMATGGAELDHGNSDLVDVSEVSLEHSEVDSEISDSIRQEGRSCHAVADTSASGQGNEIVSNSEVETFQKVKKGAEAEAVCSANSSLEAEQSIKSETFKEEGTALTLYEAELDVEEDNISAEDHGESEVATRANSIKESDSTLKAMEGEHVSPVEESNSLDLTQETQEVDAIVVDSAICFNSDADISAADHSDETHLAAVGQKEESLKSGDVECVPSKFVQPDHTFKAGGGTPALLSLRDLCNNAMEVVSQEVCASAKKLPDTTPSRIKTKSQKQKLTPKQKFVKGIKEDILAIGKSLPQDWTLPDFLVTPSSVKLENNSISVDTSEPEMKEYTDSGTYTSSHDFVLLYKIQKNLPYNLSDVKVIKCNTDKDLSGWTAECTSLSNSAPGSPKKRTPFLLDKSCNTDEISIPLSVEADLKFLKSCFPSVSEGDLKDILDNCGKDVEWAVNLLLDSGYEYNSPKATKDHAKSEGKDDDKDVDTAQEDLPEVQSPEHADVKRGEFLDTNADGHHLASPDTQSCHQPGGLATLSQNVLTDSTWLNSWGSLGGYNLPMPGEYHFDVSDMPFEQTAFLYRPKTENIPQKGSTTATTPYAPENFSDLDAIDNVEIKTRPQVDIVADHFGLIPSTESSNRPASEFKTATAHEAANAQPPLQTSTPTVEANKYQRIIDTVTGGSTAPNIEPIVYMPMPGIRKLKNSYDYLDQRQETGSDLAATVVDGSKSSDPFASPDDTDEELKEEWSSEDCGLSMELSPAMALGLQELFGPVGFHVNAESLCPDDLKIGLSYNIARLLHDAWAKTLEEKMVKEENSIKQMLKSDAELARQLQSEEDAMHHVTKVITMPRKKTASVLLSPRRSHSPKNGQSPKTRRKYTDAPSSGITFKEELPLRSSSPTTGLQQIMEEELAMKRKREEEKEKLSSSVSHVTMAMRMKRQKLYELFPGLQESILDEIFESCGYALGPTVSAIRGSTEENPQSVFTSSNLSDYEAILVREAEVESNNPKYLGKSSEDYQTFEDPDYHDFRAEATLHYNIRHECFQKAQDAHRRGMKQVATFYSQQGHMHTEKIRAANKRASERILERRSGKLQQSNTLDLHGLHVSEAIEALEDILTQRQNENADRPDKRKLHLYVVTGRGAHSKGGIAKIKPAIVSYLNRNGYRYSEPQLGMLRINVNQFAQ